MDAIIELTLDAVDTAADGRRESVDIERPRTAFDLDVLLEHCAADHVVHGNQGLYCGTPSLTFRGHASFSKVNAHRIFWAALAGLDDKDIFMYWLMQEHDTSTCLHICKFKAYIQKCYTRI